MRVVAVVVVEKVDWQTGRAFGRTLKRVTLNASPFRVYNGFAERTVAAGLECARRRRRTFKQVR